MLRCWFQTMLVTEESGKIVWIVPLLPSKKLAAAGVAALIWLRIFSRMAVTLSVVKTLAATTPPGGTPDASSASRRNLR